MTDELWCLVAAIGIGLVHVAAGSFSLKAQEGNAYTVGPRDDERRPAGVAGRLDRALRNFLETFGLFAAAVLVVHVSGRSGTLSQWGASLYVAGRVLYLPLYAIGVPWLRTIAWQVATLGLVMVIVQLFL
jgi:uncharacterized MAPEG superfamily protein